MTINKRLAWIAALTFITLGLWPQTLLSARRDDAADVRKTVRRVFDQMKSHQYDALYDSLSESSRKRISRQRFTSSMEKWDETYQLDRVEVGRVRVNGDRAVADTVFYGRLLKPSESEGKIVVQQTLVRESGQWRIAATSAGVSNSSPRIYVKRDGRWVDVTAALRAAGRRRG